MTAAEKALYNSRIINTFVGLVRKKYPQVDVEELFRYAEMSPYEVTDEGHWFTQRQIDRFHEGLYQKLGTDISREAGRFSASTESIGMMATYILGMVGPAHAFHAIRRASTSFTRSSIYTSRRLTDNSVEITVIPVEGTQEKAFQCENRVGFFEAVLMMFNYDMPEIEHPECMFKGGECCRYIVTWKKTLYSRMRLLRNWLTPPLLLLCVIGGYLDGWAHCAEASWMFLAVIFFAMGISLLSERLEKKELAVAHAGLKENSVKLVEQIGMNYNNARMVNEVGQAVSSQSDIDEVLDNVIKALENRLRYDRCLILLADQQKATLRFRTGFGYAEQQLSLLKDTAFNLTDPSSKGVFVVSFREQKPIFVNDFEKVANIHSARSVKFTDHMQAQSFICCPIVCEGESLGVLAVDNYQTKRTLVQSDMSLLTGIAPVIGISIRNAMYIERERRMAEQLRQSQKMEAVGQLAGGIAHDFNNLLTAIIGFAHLAEMTIGAEGPAQKFLEQVLAAAERATSLTQGLLAFSRNQVNNPRHLDLNAVVENIRKLLLRLISAEIELKISLSAKPLHVLADSGQLDQVIINLVTNARDAISGCGIITITSSTIEITDDFIKSHGYGSVGCYAHLSISDTGAGMDDATKARIFEPFFTTKEVGKGTGLGMAIVYGIVKQHDGYLGIDTEVGRGTAFNIYLPLQLEKQFAPTVTETDHRSYSGTETILVAEDATEVRLLNTEVLRQNGYTVIEAVDGVDAVQKFKENREAIALIIMDVVMPHMNGKDAFAEIAKTDPQMKVLFTSGYTPDDVNKKGVAFHDDNFLAKPSSPQSLLKKVRALLDS
jgi:signal transduction histidine kinase